MRKPQETIRPVVDNETGRLQGFRLSPEGARKNAINRRAFLRGAGTVAIGLPFLEGLPERSAWAAGGQPVFTMMIVGSCGVVGKSFLPDATGPLQVMTVLGPIAPETIGNTLTHDHVLIDAFGLFGDDSSYELDHALTHLLLGTCRLQILDKSLLL